jgi:excisionase family DNA binding protein
MIEPTDLISTAEAREILGVSHDKMARLLRTGAIKHYRDVRDLRLKLVSRRDIDALKAPRDRVA